MSRKQIIKGIISITLTLLIGLTLPVQVFAQNIPRIDDGIFAGNPQEAKPYQVGNILGEVTTKREEYSKQFRLDDGSYMAVSYEQPVHFKNEQGKWIDYDNSLVDETTSSATNDELSDGEYTNKRSDIKVNYSKKSKENNMIKIKADDYQISWGYKNTNKVTATVVTKNEQLEGNEKYTALKNLTSEILYENVYDNVDIQYITSSVGIKENIILKNSNAQSDFTIEYKINSLTAKAVNDKLIELCDKSGDVIYSIEAPFMIDADGKSSTQLSLSIAEQKNSKLTLNLSTDKAFLSECEYPVIIDPKFTTNQDWQTSECTFADSSHPDTAYGYESSTGYTGTVYVGTFGQGMYRAYLKMKSLPTLNKGDMVVGAYVNMHLYNNNFYDDMTVTASYVSESWSQSTLTWNNKPAFESTVIDYETFVANNSDAWHDWDITKCVKRWYNGETNNGIMLKSSNESAESQCASFYSSNYPASSIPRPLFTIVYQNNKGLEDYWTYSSFSAGTAGTAYVNDYSGNLVFVTSDASTASGYASASVQHVYNGYMANKKYDFTTPYVGYGWRLNIEQTIATSDKFGLTGDNADNYPYVYTDQDGTDHYFYKKTENNTTKYLDEDGLGLELKVNNGSTPERFVISDDKDNKIAFYSSGRLNYTQDSNGNKVTVNYSGSTITSVTDGSGNKILLERTPGSTSGYLRYIKDPVGRTTEYKYNDNGKLIKIIYPNGKNVSFGYDTEWSLNSVTDVDGYKLQFTYTSASSGKKVSSIQEIGKNGTVGQKITFDRTKYNTTIIKTYGADGISGTSDDLTSTYQFDEFGRTVSVKSKTASRDLGASVYRYTDGVKNTTASNIKQLNRVSTSYSTGSNPVNMIKNSNMETTAAWTPSAWCGTNSFTSGYSTDEKYFGAKSLIINVASYEGDSRGRVYQDFSSTEVKPGGIYTLSGYVKTVGVTNSSNVNSGAFICAESVNSDGTTTTFHSDYVKGNTSTSVDGGWQRVSVTFKVPENSVKTRIHLALRTSTGKVFFDGVQLESYSVANNCNLLENAGFEEGSGGWTGEYSNLNSSTDNITSTSTYSGSNSFGIQGSSEYAKGIKQTVKVSGSEKDTYIVSGWAKARAVPSNNDQRKFKISVKITYSDGYSVWQSSANFNHSVSDWQFASAAFTLSDGDSTKNRVPVSITVCPRYQYQSNYAYFDNICLEKDNAQSYTYNEDGKLISVVDNSEEKSKMEYTNSDLTKNIDAKGYDYNYTYDSKHNMTQAKSQTGVTYNYAYNSKGLATSLEVKCSSNYKLKSEVTYNSNGLLATSKDQDGNSTTYNYNNNTGTLTSTMDGESTVSYTYDGNTDVVTSVSETIDDTDTATVNYTYSDDSKQLKKISRNDTEYNIEYDEYGNKTDSKVGTQSLASYTYNQNNGALISSTYGTGQTVSYEYDAFGNTSKQKYNGNTAFSWAANRSGEIVKEYDYINGTMYDYVKDSTGRLVRKNAINSTASGSGNKAWYSTEYSYDLNNNITRLALKTPYRENVNRYTYGKDNLLTKFDINDNRSVSYTYDGLNRLTKTSVSTDTAVETTYTYSNSNRGTGYTTTKLASETIGGVTYKYSYDTHGNITEIKNGANETLYLYGYDLADRLTYVADNENSKTYSYGYDTGGNLISETVSDIGSNGIPISTRNISYSYGDSNWKDKLTSYDGQSITYDAIGNPLTYRNGMTMTWKNGRQLATLQQGNNSISYSYGSDSVRVSKTVNGVKYTYAYLNGLLMYETRGNAKFYYSYDANGTLYSVKYTLTDSSALMTYYFTHNSRGDIVGIYNGAGQLRAHYEYDAWGNVLSVTDQNGNAITSSTHIGNLNPFRYRGYYFDSETGLYYLMSRYYDPVTHRFVNADGYFQSSEDVLDGNMSAYCGNNPIMRADHSGEFWGIAAIIAAAVIVTTIVTAVVFPENPVTGASASITHNTTHEETYTPSWSPITCTTGSTVSTTKNYGDSTKPVSVYAEGRSDNWLVSSAGVKINIFDFTFKISVGLDNIGFSGIIKSNDVSNSLGIRADLSKLKIGFEHSTTYKWDEQNSNTEYTNVSVNGWALAAAYIFATSGISVPAFG